jgi:hypothetical protein
VRLTRSRCCPHPTVFPGQRHGPGVLPSGGRSLVTIGGPNVPASTWSQCPAGVRGGSYRDLIWSTNFSDSTDRRLVLTRSDWRRSEI